MMAEVRDLETASEAVNRLVDDYRLRCLLEVRDWIDVIESHDRIQPLGFLAWAACGPDAAALSRRWHELRAEARRVVEALPEDRAGTCVLTTAGDLCRAQAAELSALLTEDSLLFHAGSIRGALPRLIESGGRA
jgi:hypothetical protein